MDRIIQRRQNRMRKKLPAGEMQWQSISRTAIDLAALGLGWSLSPYTSMTIRKTSHGASAMPKREVSSSKARSKQGAALTPATGRHTLAGVDALKVMAALNFSEPDDDEALLCRLAPS